MAVVICKRIGRQCATRIYLVNSKPRLGRIWYDLCQPEAMILLVTLAKVRDAGNLLTRAALAIPSVDVDDVVIQYSHPARLIAHLRVSSSSPRRTAPPTLSFSPLTLLSGNTSGFQPPLLLRFWVAMV
jgi:hypothetical protein